MSLSQMMLSRFRGREDHVAVGGENDFHPEPWSISTKELEKRHLSGEQCLGFYLLDADSRCWCSCVDFDNKPDSPDPKWKEKAEQTYYALTPTGLTPLVEVSQSGRGCHIWLFFSEPTPAWLPRAWWRAIGKRVGVDYKEIYPRQDRHTGKGLGNLVRYPLWNESKFVDVEDGWKAVDPELSMKQSLPFGGSDLSLLAFQMGMGELVPEDTAAVEVVRVEGGSALLPLRVQKLLGLNRGLLCRRWKCDATGMKDQSKSAIAMSIATELVRLYVPTPEIASSLRYWCANNGAEKKADRDEWVAHTLTKAYDFVVERTEKRSAGVLTFKEAADAYLEQLEKGTATCVPSGLELLDESVEGLANGEMGLIAARPGHGKSALAFQWLDHAASLGLPGLLISEEMSAVEIGKRRLLSISMLPQEKWSAETAPILREENKDYHAKRSPVHVVEGCNTIDRAEEVIDQMCALRNVRLVAVDYAQLLTARMGDRYEVVTEISRRMKQCARRNNIPLLLLSQLNREVEKRQDNEPKLSDLRESGQLEQDADLILFLQWPHKFDSSIDKSVYRIYAAKRRNGPIRNARIETRFDPEKQRMGGVVYQDPPPMPPRRVRVPYANDDLGDI